MKKFYINILLITALSSCTYFDNGLRITKPGDPGMKWMYDAPPERKDGKEYPQMYIDGWRDGCETGVSANTNSFYKYFNKFKQDGWKAQDEVYYKGWKDAFNYCGRYIYQYNRKLGF